MPVLKIEGKEVRLSNLDKVYFPALNITKGEVIDYYIRMAPHILPHLFNRPFSMLNFPDGYGNKSFYRKQCPPEAPPWIETVAIPSSRKGEVDWCLVNNTATLVWMINRSCIEMHTWTAKISALDRPDIALIDLDPNGNSGFKEALQLARAYAAILQELKLKAYVKTSGATGIHICIPLKPVHSFAEVREFLTKISRPVLQAYPEIATMERTIKKRGDKVLLDVLQNAAGKTMPPPYSLRVTPTATVSTPLLWPELEDDTLLPERFNINNIFERIARVGDITADLRDLQQVLPHL